MNRPQPAAVPRQALFETEGLYVGYHGEPAICDVDLAIRGGVITAFMGPSGCGKSSLLMALNRLTDLIPGCQVAGSVRFQGMDVFAPDTDVVGLRRRVGMIFQKPNPFPTSIERNLSFPLRHHGIKDREEQAARIEQALRDVGLWEDVKDRLRHPAPSLSGGQQQRLCIARALVLRPDVLLMDEPCSALDPISAGVVEDHIASLRGRLTVVIVTHNVAQARRLADDAAFFWVDRCCGRLVEAGPASALFESPRSPLTAAYVSGARG